MLDLKGNDFFLDSCVPFGFIHGSNICTRLSNTIRYTMLKCDYHIIKYIDDLIVYGLSSQIHQSFNTPEFLCCLYKVDISRAFRHVKIKPWEVQYAGPQME